MPRKTSGEIAKLWQNYCNGFDDAVRGARTVISSIDIPPTFDYPDDPDSSTLTAIIESLGFGEPRLRRFYQNSQNVIRSTILKEVDLYAAAFDGNRPDQVVITDWRIRGRTATRPFAEIAERLKTEESARKRGRQDTLQVLRGFTHEMGNVCFNGALDPAPLPPSQTTLRMEQEEFRLDDAMNTAGRFCWTTYECLTSLDKYNGAADIVQNEFAAWRTALSTGAHNSPYKAGHFREYQSICKREGVSLTDTPEPQLAQNPAASKRALISPNPSGG